MWLFAIDSYLLLLCKFYFSCLVHKLKLFSNKKTFYSIQVNLKARKNGEVIFQHQCNVLVSLFLKLSFCHTFSWFLILHFLVSLLRICLSLFCLICSKYFFWRESRKQKCNLSRRIPPFAAINNNAHFMLISIQMNGTLKLYLFRPLFLNLFYSKETFWPATCPWNS